MAWACVALPWLKLIKKMTSSKYHTQRRYRLHRRARKDGYKLITGQRTFYVPQSEINSTTGKFGG